MFKFISTKQLIEFSSQECRLTHFHELSVEVCVVCNLICRVLIETIGNWNQALNFALENMLNPKNNELKQILQKIINKEYNEKEISQDGFCLNVLFAALYFIDNSKNFSEALERSLKFAGNANYCPVLVGSIGGSRWGLSEIPKSHWNELDQETKNRLESISNYLEQQWK